MITPGSRLLNVSLQIRRKPEATQLERIFATRSRCRLPGSLPGPVLMNARGVLGFWNLPSLKSKFCWCNALSRVTPSRAAQPLFTVRPTRVSLCRCESSCNDCHG